MSSSAVARGTVGDGINERDDSALERATIGRVGRHILPFVFILYVANFIDRTNLAIAALQMNRDLHLSAAVYGLGAGIFALGYSSFEVPSNLILARVGARRWIACIMIAWGCIASAMMLVRTPGEFYALRFLLGVAEAGFFPGVVYYLNQWFPAAHRARAIARFMAAVPLSAAIGGPLGGWILSTDGWLGLRGWQWLFLIEGAPAVLLGIGALGYLTDSVAKASWLTVQERDWLVARLERDRGASPAAIHDPRRALTNPRVWAAALPVFLMLTAGYAFLFWAPLVIRDSLGATNLQTGLLVGAIGVVTAAAMVLLGASSDRRGERFLHAAACTMLSAIGFAGAALFPTPWGPVIAMLIISIGQNAWLPIFWCVPSTWLRASGAAAGIALVNGVGSLGGFAGPYVVGLFKSQTGSTTGAFLLMAGVSAAAGVALLVLRRREVHG